MAKAYRSLQDAELEERPDLKKHLDEESNQILVDGNYLFMTGRGMHSWSPDKDAWNKGEQAEWTTEETPTMQEVRKAFESTSAYQEWVAKKQ